MVRLLRWHTVCGRCCSHLRSLNFATAHGVCFSGVILFVLPLRPLASTGLDYYGHDGTRLCDDVATGEADQSIAAILGACAAATMKQNGQLDTHSNQ